MRCNTLTRAMILMCLPVAAVAQTGSAWVSDQFEVMLRTGPSTSNAIERMLPSGTELEVLEKDAGTGYSRVRTTSGVEGWVLSRYLMSEPSAREQLARLTSQLTNATDQGSTLNAQLDAVRDEYDSATRRIAALEVDKQRLQEELDEIRQTAADVLAINSQNKELRAELADAELYAATLEQQNREMTSQTTRYWFMTGALVLVVGIILGIWLPRIRWQRRSRYDRF